MMHDDDAWCRISPWLSSPHMDCSICEENPPAYRGAFVVMMCFACIPPVCGCSVGWEPALWYDNHARYCKETFFQTVRVRNLANWYRIFLWGSSPLMDLCMFPPPDGSIRENLIPPAYRGELGILLCIMLFTSNPRTRNVY